MLRGLFVSLLKTVTLTPTPELFRFATGRREATIDTAVRVAASGRIVGFGDSTRADKTQVLPLFSRDGKAIDEPALAALCRRGLQLALGPWAIVRPRVVVRGAERVPVPRELFVRALRAAGAFAVEFED